jgi:hypothetical protein
MDGERKASAHDIVFQARAGSPELNCCSVNGPRGLGTLSEWAVMSSRDAVVLNYYGPSAFGVTAPSGERLRLVQETDYPDNGHVTLKVDAAGAEATTLKLRIPGWSRKTSVQVNGNGVAEVRPGSYLSLEREWQAGDVIELNFDMSPRFWVGEREAAGKTAVYRGPVLLAYDPRFDRHDPTKLPALDVRRVAEEKYFTPLRCEAGSSSGPAPLVLVEVPTTDGGTMKLCDFATAGAAGNVYASWLPAVGLTQSVCEMGQL